jgi:putative AdoMet-dependent methyltransferase
VSEDRWGFNEWAKSYDEDILNAARADNWIFRDYDRVLDKVVEYCHLAENKYTSVLDIGVGTGNLAARFVAPAMQVFGIDPSEEMRDICQQKHPEITVIDGDFLKIPLNIPHVDLIVSAYAFHHLTAVQKWEAVPLMKRFLNPKGRIVIADLMFRNAAEESRIKLALYKAGRTDILQEFEDEYPGLFEELTLIFTGEGFSFQGERLTESIWILSAFL